MRLEGFTILYRLFIRCCANWHFRKSLAAIHRGNISLLCVWNGHQLALSAAVAAAKHASVEIRYFENGLLPGYTVCDSQGVNANNSMPRTAAFYRDYARSESLSPTTEAVLETQQQRQNRKPPELPERYLFAPLQMPLDSQILLHSPDIQTMAQFINALVRMLERVYAPDLNLLIKPHPRAVQEAEFLSRSAAHQQILFTSDWSIEELLSRAEAVITINSTVGMEAIAAGKKVICLGDACYNIPGLTLSAKNITELSDAVKQLPEWQPDPDVHSGFMLYMQREYLIPGNPANVTAEHIETLRERFQLANSG